MYCIYICYNKHPPIVFHTNRTSAAPRLHANGSDELLHQRRVGGQRGIGGSGGELWRLVLHGIPMMLSRNYEYSWG